MKFRSTLLLAGLAVSSSANAHWHLESEPWLDRTKPEEIPAELKTNSRSSNKATPVYYSNAVRVLGYHDVFIENNVSPTSDVLPGNFRDQMEFLKRAGYNVLTMEQVNALISGVGTVPDNAVAITFDDDYRGQYWEAYPILEELDFPATFYVHSQYVGVMTGKDHTTWNELRIMIENGHDVQSHTVTHANLRTLQEGGQLVALDNELLNSKNTIEAQLNKTVDQICYPNGGYNATVIQRAENFGYLYGQTVIGGLNTSSTPPMETRRNLLGVGDTLATFKNMLGYTGTDPGGPIIVDNTSVNFTATGFTQTGSTNPHRGQYGTNYREAAATTGAATATASWTANVPQDGQYDVYAWWPNTLDASLGKATGVVYSVSNGAPLGSQAFAQNRTTKGKWNLIGRFALSSSSPVVVSVTNHAEAGSTTVYADAIKIAPAPAETSANMWDAY